MVGISAEEIISLGSNCYRYLVRKASVGKSNFFKPSNYFNIIYPKHVKLKKNMLWLNPVLIIKNQLLIYTNWEFVKWTASPCTVISLLHNLKSTVDYGIDLCKYLYVMLFIVLFAYGTQHDFVTVLGIEACCYSY